MLARNSILAPRPIRTNQPYTYATWNNADKAANISLSADFLTTTRAGAGPAGVRGTIGKSSGLWQFQVKAISTSGVFDIWGGLANSTHVLTTLPGQSNANGWAVAADGGDYYNNGFIGIASSTWPLAVNDVLTILWNATAQTLILKRNSTILTPNPLFSNLSGTLFPIITTQNDTTVLTANFGATALDFPDNGYNLGVYQ
jgi:hypothetical protein